MKASGYINTLLLVFIMMFISCNDGREKTLSGHTLTELTINCEEIPTRSVLQAGLENKVNDIVLWIYDSRGKLERAEYFKQQETARMQLYLSDKETYEIYALVNMGSINAPATKKLASIFQYRIPSYRDLQEKGIPMAGILSSFRPSSKHGTIRVRRLFAKINLTMAPGEVSPDEISSVEVFNCNMRLSPFSEAGSKAEKQDDVTSGEENERICHYGWEGNHFVFYIPENIQGNLLPDNTDQNQKTPENLALHGKKAQASLCTYIETTVKLKNPGQHNGIAGTARYRFYLGEDNTSDFSLKRNVSYETRLGLTWNGQFYEDNWRIDNSQLNDSRSIDIEGILGFTLVGSSFKIERGNNLNIIPGYAGGFSVDFNDGSNPDKTTDDPYGSTFDSPANCLTLEKYGKRDGWTISETTKRMLASYGINWTVCQAVIDQSPQASDYIETINQIGFVPKKLNTSDSMIYGENFRVYVIFDVPGNVAEGTVIPIEICTTDRTRSKTISLNVSSNDIRYNIISSDLLAGTSPIMELKPLKPGISRLRLTVAPESINLLNIQKIDELNYKLFLKKAGKAEIRLSAENQGSFIQYPSIRLDISNPVLKIEPQEIILSINGAPTAFQVSYYTSENGKKMEMARTDEEATGNVLAPTLFMNELMPAAEILDGVTMKYKNETIVCSQNNLYNQFDGMNGEIRLAKVYSSGQTLSLLKVHVPSSTIQATYCPIRVEDILSGFDKDTDYGNYLFATTKSVPLPQNLGSNLRKYDHAALSSKPLLYDKKKYQIEIKDNAGHFVSHLTDQDRMEIVYSAHPSSYTPGKVELTAVIRDKVTRKILLEKPIGFLHSYLYTLVGPEAGKADANTINVYAKVAGSEEVEAFSCLERNLTSYPNRVSTTFRTDKKWSTIDARTDCYSIPQTGKDGTTLYPNEKDSNSHLTLWESVKENGTFGELMYQIRAGDLFQQFFRNWADFSSQYTPDLRIDLRDISILGPLEGMDTKLFYYKYAQDNGRDPDGNPYYLVYCSDNQLWINEDFR